VTRGDSGTTFFQIFCLHSTRMTHRECRASLSVTIAIPRGPIFVLSSPSPGLDELVGGSCSGSCYFNLSPSLDVHLADPPLRLTEYPPSPCLQSTENLQGVSFVSLLLSGATDFLDMTPPSPHRFSSQQPVINYAINRTLSPPPPVLGKGASSST